MPEKETNPEVEENVLQVLKKIDTTVIIPKMILMFCTDSRGQPKTAQTKCLSIIVRFISIETYTAHSI